MVIKLFTTKIVQNKRLSLIYCEEKPHPANLSDNIIYYVRNGSCKLNRMLCICSLFLKYRKLSRIFLENFKNSILRIFVPLSIIENICF